MEAILKHKNPKANPNNALQIRELDGLCCGDTAKAIVCKYAVTIPTGTQATASKISIGGTVYDFGVAVDLTTAGGRTLLVTKIKEALAAAGYTTDGVDVTVSGANVTVTTWFSQVTFDYLHSSTYAFTKVSGQCRTVGNFDVSVCTADATITVSGGYVIIHPYASERMTKVTVNDGTADRYDAALVTTAGSPSGNASSVNGAVYLSVSGLSYSGTETFTITVVQEGCPNIALTRSIAVS